MGDSLIPLCRTILSKKKKKRRKTTVTSNTTHLITLFYTEKPVDASLSTANAFSLNNLVFTTWEPDYVTLSADYGQSEEIKLRVSCNVMTG